MKVHLPYSTLVALVADRLALLADPPSREPSPVARGATPRRWAELGGIGGPLHESLHIVDPLAAPVPGRPPKMLEPLDPEGYPPEQLALDALRKLRTKNIVAWAGPGLYRPVRRRQVETPFLSRRTSGSTHG